MLERIKDYYRQFPEPRAGARQAPLCRGGDLEPERLLAAYLRGIFPWYSQGNPILWWSPDPRCVLLPENFVLPARSARYLKNNPFELSFDTAFDQVIDACAQPRGVCAGTWLVPEMLEAYKMLHRLGFAHSVESWRNGALAGGLYGVWLGNAFFGESMFHKCGEASRAALWGLVDLLRANGCQLIDCQQSTPHMLKMGATPMPRTKFLGLLNHALRTEPLQPRMGALYYSAGTWSVKS